MSTHTLSESPKPLKFADAQALASYIENDVRRLEGLVANMVVLGTTSGDLTPEAVYFAAETGEKIVHDLAEAIRQAINGETEA